MVKRTVRTKPIGFKVREEEHAQLDAVAQTAGGRSVSGAARFSWRVNGQEPKSVWEKAK